MAGPVSASTTSNGSPKRLRVLHRRQHREDADAIGDEIGRVAWRGSRPCRASVSGTSRARPEARRRCSAPAISSTRCMYRGGLKKCTPQKRGRTASGSDRRQRGERQSRRVGREDRVAARDAARPSRRGRASSRGARRSPRSRGRIRASRAKVGCRSWQPRWRSRDPWPPAARARCLARFGDGLGHEAVGIALLRRQVEQQHRNAGVGEVRGDLRAHDAGAEDGGLANRKKRS